MAIDTELNWYGDDKKIDINKATIKALTRSINIVQGHAKTIVPVAEKNGGTLRGSIVKGVFPNTLSATVSTNTEYAAYVEFGLRSNPNYPIQPYMRPALNDNKAKIKKIFIDEESKAVDK